MPLRLDTPRIRWHRNKCSDPNSPLSYARNPWHDAGHAGLHRTGADRGRLRRRLDRLTEIQEAFLRAQTAFAIAAVTSSSANFKVAVLSSVDVKVQLATMTGSGVAAAV